MKKQDQRKFCEESRREIWQHQNHPHSYHQDVHSPQDNRPYASYCYLGLYQKVEYKRKGDEESRLMFDIPNRVYIYTYILYEPFQPFIDQLLEPMITLILVFCHGNYAITAPLPFSSSANGAH